MHVLSFYARCGTLLCSLVLMANVGCTVPRVAQRWFDEDSAAVTAETPHYISGQLPLPSAQAVQPVAVQMPAGGQYDTQAVQDIRSRRTYNSFGSSPRGSNCFS